MMKRMMAALLVFSLLWTLAPAADASPSPDEVEAAIARLFHYGLINDPRNDAFQTPGPFLDLPLTRAQLAAILVRSWGQEEDAKLLMGAPTGYDDVDGEEGLLWATGYIVVANRIVQAGGGQRLGASPTTFRPMGEITPIEILALTMKFLGLPVGTGERWMAETMQTAREAGLLAGDAESKYLARPTEPVTRGHAFAFLDYLFAAKWRGGGPVPAPCSPPLLTPADEVSAVYERFRHYGIIQPITPPMPGDQDLPITRAQLLVVLIRAWGREPDAKVLRGSTTGFTDVDGQDALAWTTGYIAAASKIAQEGGGQSLGAAGAFRPNDQPQAIEVLAFTMKFLGLPVGNGPDFEGGTIRTARAAGLLTAESQARYLARPTAKLNRGEVFVLLDHLFSRPVLASGKSVYTTYIDPEPPGLTLFPPPPETTTAHTLTLSGSVSGGDGRLCLNGERVDLHPDSTFTVDVPLRVGPNSLTLTVTDPAGNLVEQSFLVRRTVEP